MVKILSFSLLFVLAVQLGVSQESSKKLAFQNITEDLIAGQLEFLSSDWTLGRDLGTKGAYMASDYIASMFKTFGLKPGGDPIPAPRRRGRGQQAPTNPYRATTSYFQNFNLLEYRSGDEQSCSILSINGNSMSEIKLNSNVDFRLVAGSRAVSIQSDVVFVGYGFVGEGYNDFANIDVRDKVIVRLNGFPGHKNKDSKAYKKYGTAPSYIISRGKDTEALLAGAAAIIDIYPGRQSFKPIPDNVPFRYNDKDYEGDEPYRMNPRVRLTNPDNNSSITIVSLSEKSIELLLNGAELDFEKFESLAENKGKTASRVLNSKRIKIETNIVTRTVQARNVVGIIEGKKKDTCIVLGAHFDHLGQVRNNIYNGADDNASGTVGIMTIAKAIMETGIQPEYTLVFCAWTGEEKGLIGSRYFAENPLIPNIKCYMNYDMISRVALDDPDKNKCDFQFTSTVPILKSLTEKHIKEFDINLDIAYNGSEKPTGGSDFSSFSAKGIPIFLFHGKFTPAYHHFSDHADQANLTYMRDIIRAGFLNIYELSTQTW